MKVVDQNDEMVPFGTPGELCCRGCFVMQGYYKDADKTGMVLRKGWFHTGWEYD